jgi:hypothetical protein
MLLILIFMIAMVPFSTASEGASTMQAPGPGTRPTVDGKWSAGEWDDALECSVANSTLTSYVRVKWNGSFFYILIDSPWDTTNSSIYPYENTWIAFDTMHNYGSAPQTDDYMFSISAMVAYKGDGKPRVVAVTSSALGYSPARRTPHPTESTSSEFH